MMKHRLLKWHHFQRVDMNLWFACRTIYVIRWIESHWELLKNDHVNRSTLTLATGQNLDALMGIAERDMLGSPPYSKQENRRTKEWLHDGGVYRHVACPISIKRWRSHYPRGHWSDKWLVFDAHDEPIISMPTLREAKANAELYIKENGLARA